MLRKFVGAFVVVCAMLGVALADEFNATINKVEDGKVTFTKKAKKGEKGEQMTLPATKDVKVTKGKQDGKKVVAGDPLEGGLKNEAFTNVGKKGVGARIITDADNKNIVEIILTPQKKKAQ
jgi:hypothetical protein